MKPGDKLLKEINKKYTPSTTIPLKFGRYDMVVKTNDEGYAILLFIGKADEDGIIKGNRFTRVLIKDSNGNTIKDHWDHKGKI
ncbi:hypothetical protein ACFP1I_06415 [Dyadobacter subterraneus]|uniref:Uncharacterized protein n=1 Tax=Dyadobacter subterraneus TaxID=2773304 RepID=A0ABR9WFN3_9BACT|nr:hypothetical protein [Dyadobacter subterraneus]MBE9464237.1 hypothetical protein [Dyadobacter subterraneus]